MGRLKAKILWYCLCLVLWVIAFGMLWIHANWWTAVGVFLALTANNIERTERFHNKGDE